VTPVAPDEGGGDEPPERAAAFVEAQEAYGRRAIARTRCRHRLPCTEATDHAGVRVHIDGLTFADAAAARAFDRRRLAGGARGWRTFRSWDEARTWLREGV
jgi:hypothetical protein